MRFKIYYFIYAFENNNLNQEYGATVYVSNVFEIGTFNDGTRAYSATVKKEIEFLQSYPNNYYILSKCGKPGQNPISTKWLNDEHRKVLDELKIIGRYAFYSWKHTGVVKAVKSGLNIKDLQLQLRHHSLDMVNEYLKNLGVLDSEDLINRYPTL